MLSLYHVDIIMILYEIICRTIIDDVLRSLKISIVTLKPLQPVHLILSGRCQEMEEWSVSKPRSLRTFEASPTKIWFNITIYYHTLHMLPGLSQFMVFHEQYTQNGLFSRQPPLVLTFRKTHRKWVASEAVEHQCSQEMVKLLLEQGCADSPAPPAMQGFFLGRWKVAMVTAW